MKRPEYFPVLDCMRFLAALGVFVAHSTVFFVSPGTKLAFGPFLGNAGYYGVIFFYTLSGFLITFLLLKEKEATNTISLRQFYFRRASRIWPLYYLMTVLSFLVFRHWLPDGVESGADKWVVAFLLYLFFFPNAAVLTGYYSPTSFQLYTIGFEEQFYLIWPLLIRKLPVKSLFLPAFFAPLLLSLVHTYLHAHGIPSGGGINAVIRGALTYIDYSCLPAFAAGGAAAYYYSGGKGRLQWLEKRNWGYVLVTLLILSMWLGIPQAPGYVNWLAILFALIILHFVGRENAKPGDGGLLAAGGRISYGIYVYHPAVLLLVAAGFKKLPVIGMPLINYLLFVFLSLTLVLVLASLSYRLFERRFLRRKTVAAI